MWFPPSTRPVPAHTSPIHNSQVSKSPPPQDFISRPCHQVGQGPAVREPTASCPASISAPAREQQDGFLVISTSLRQQVTSSRLPENSEEISLSQISLILTPTLLISPATPTLGNTKSVQLFNSPSMTDCSSLPVPSVSLTSLPTSLLVKSSHRSACRRSSTSSPSSTSPPRHSSLSTTTLSNINQILGSNGLRHRLR